MKTMIYGGLTALLLAASHSAMAIPASQIAAAESSMVFNFSAPILTNSGVRGSAQFLTVAVIGMSLNDLMIGIPPQMAKFDKVIVTDQTGRQIPAKVQLSKSRAAITFDQPVAPGNYVTVEFADVQLAPISDGSILLYQVTGMRQGLQGEIPIGTARVQLPNRS